MARHRLTGIAGAVCGILMAVLASCSEAPPAFEPGEVEGLVLDRLGSVLPARPVGVDCDSMPPRAEPGSAWCTVEVNGADEALAVEIVSDGEGGIDVRPRQAVLIRADLIDMLDDELEDRHGRPFTVDCDGTDVMIAEPGRDLECVATDDDHERTILVTVLDVAGRVEARIVEGG